jgi:septum formation protein
MRHFVLASKSPRRREILANAGLDFEVRAADVEEIPEVGEAPVDYVRRLARAKARAVPASEGELVLGADTIVVVDGTILEKPADDVDARRMLAMLGGRAHEVITGICLVGDGREAVDHAVTTVRFAPWSAEEIAFYVATGEPMDKAGAYGIQGVASRWIEGVDGCYLNVVGLPLSLVYKHGKTFAV